jgi:hypothetical protein
MAIVVAPLTATVLNAAGSSHSGTASGISNAVARVAALLAIAAFGILNASGFGRVLDRRLDAAHVPAPLRHALDAQLPKLGAMRPPAGTSAEDERVVTGAIHDALNSAFREVALGSAALSVVASACAAWGVRRERARR